MKFDVHICETTLLPHACVVRVSVIFRLGLGADAAVDNALKGKSVFDVGVQQCVNGRRKPPKRERQGKTTVSKSINTQS